MHRAAGVPLCALRSRKVATGRIGVCAVCRDSNPKNWCKVVVHSRMKRPLRRLCLSSLSSSTSQPKTWGH